MEASEDESEGNGVCQRRETREAKREASESTRSGKRPNNILKILRVEEKPGVEKKIRKNTPKTGSRGEKDRPEGKRYNL